MQNDTSSDYVDIRNKLFDVNSFCLQNNQYGNKTFVNADGAKVGA